MRIARVALVAALIVRPSAASAAPARAARAKPAAKSAAKPTPAPVPRPAPPIGAALTGGDVNAAIAAARALGDDGSAEAHGALADALATGLHPKVAAAALPALARAP